MPEGHTIHRLARDLDRRFRRTRVAASSPQGRFADGAALLDGETVTGARAHGKHLLVAFGPFLEGGPSARSRAAGRRSPPTLHTLHVHLGLYGRFVTGAGGPPPVRGALRLRLVSVHDAPDATAVPGVPDAMSQTEGQVGPGPAWGDLRGPTACELLGPAEVTALLARLGPDPLQPDPRGEARAAFVARVGASRSAVGGLLMRQDLIAGVGNIYRAEALFRAGVHPERPGLDVGAAELGAVWDDLVVLLRDGVRSGRIVTTEIEHRLSNSTRGGALGRGAGWRQHAYYVYRRTGLPCRVCGTAVEAGEMVARSVFWCPTCQLR